MNPNLIDSLGWAMAQVYASVTDRLLINLARHFRFIKDGAPIPKSWEYQMQKLAEMGQVTRESEAIILKSLGGADEALQLMLETAIRDGLKTAEPALRKGAEKGLLKGQGFLPPELAPNQMQAFRAFYRQSADKLNLVNTVMLESTQQAYQATLSDIVTRINNTQQILNTASGEVITGVSSFNQALRDGVNKMVDNGLTGFIDHGGHHWSPEAYVAMDTRTTVANTARAAVFERMEDYSDDLYVVSWHNGARPLCYPWQLKVISRSDWTGEVEDLDGNKIHVYAQSETSYGEPAGLFGINCKHYPSPFIPGVSTIHGELQDKEANDKAYAESQEQWRLERKLRQEKRDLEVMKAQGATDEEIKAQRMRVKNANADLNNFCDETGRARVPWREKAPVDAKFPDEYQQTRYVAKNAPQTPPVSSDNSNGKQIAPKVENVNVDIEQFRSAAVGAQNEAEFWMNFTPEQQAAYNASGLDFKELFKMVKDDAPISEWKAPNPGGAETFAIKHDFSNHGIGFEEVAPRSDGWMADANNSGIIHVRRGGLGEDWDHIISHEAGHQLSNASPELQRIIMDNPGNVLGRYNTRLMAFDGVYGEYNPEEAFATSVSVFVRYPEDMAKRYPDTYKAIENLFDSSPSAREYVENVRKAYRKKYGL